MTIWSALSYIVGSYVSILILSFQKLRGFIEKSPFTSVGKGKFGVYQNIHLGTVLWHFPLNPSRSKWISPEILET